jgi:uncharacterized protein with FMN-binding domain
MSASAEGRRLAPADRSAARRKTNQLVALGSAAVIAVYAAGYARTRAAAERLSSDEHRRPMIPALPESGPAAAMPEPPAPTVVKPVAEPTRNVARAKTSAPAPSTTVEEKSATTDAPPVVGPPPVVAIAIDPAAATVPPPVPVTPPVDPKPAEPAHAVKPLLRDGTYSGWGTSRHGDIQATIVIDNGRITSASISQCLTRYSCSWIAELIPQVAQRQSADVDYVSGATQSSNAFYYAVLEALAKAK